jgi:hypothetical protein
MKNKQLLKLAFVKEAKRRWFTAFKNNEVSHDTIQKLTNYSKDEILNNPKKYVQLAHNTIGEKATKNKIYNHTEWALKNRLSHIDLAYNKATDDHYHSLGRAIRRHIDPSKATALTQGIMMRIPVRNIPKTQNTPGSTLLHTPHIGSADSKHIIDNLFTNKRLMGKSDIGDNPYYETVLNNKLQPLPNLTDHLEVLFPTTQKTRHSFSSSKLKLDPARFVYKGSKGYVPLLTPETLNMTPTWWSGLPRVSEGYAFSGTTAPKYYISSKSAEGKKMLKQLRDNASESLEKEQWGKNKEELLGNLTALRNFPKRKEYLSRSLNNPFSPYMDQFNLSKAIERLFYLQ